MPAREKNIHTIYGRPCKPKFNVKLDNKFIILPFVATDHELIRRNDLGFQMADIPHHPCVLVID